MRIAGCMVEKRVGKKGVSYRLVVSNGYIKGGSEQVKVSTTWKPADKMTDRQIEAELQRQCAEFYSEVKGGTYIKDRLRVSDMLDKWYTEIALKKSTNYIVDVEKTIRLRLIPELGNIRLSELTTKRVQEFVTSLGADGQNRKTGGKLSPKSIKNILAVLSSALAQAVLWRDIAVNPAIGVTLPNIPDRAVEVEQQSLDSRQLKELLNFVKSCGDSQMEVIIKLAVFAGGLRRGELVALTWADIDFNRCLISINKEAEYISKRLNIGTREVGQYTKPPKSRMGRRVVHIAPEFVKELLEFKQRQEELALSLGTAWKGANDIFVNSLGERLAPGTPTHKFKAYVRAFNKAQESDKGRIPESAHLHSLRHTGSSLLVAQGVDVKTVQAIAGHSQASFTMNTYVHPFDDNKKEAARLLTNGIYD